VTSISTDARPDSGRSFVVALAPPAAPFVFPPPPAAQVHGENDEEKRNDKENGFHEGEKSLMDIG
jgi:hypothetical protein